MFTPPSIPEGMREELAEYAWTLWAGEGKSHRMIAEQILVERKIRISHVTVGHLVKEGRDAMDMPLRTEVAKDVHLAARHLLSALWEERRAAGATTMDIAPSVLKALERLVRLHGADAPTRVSLHDDRPLPTPDPDVLRIVEATIEQSSRAVSDLRAGAIEGEDPTP